MSKLFIVELPDGDLGAIDIASGLVRVGLGDARVAPLFDAGSAGLYISLNDRDGAFRYLTAARAALARAADVETITKAGDMRLRVTLDADGNYHFEPTDEPEPCGFRWRQGNVDRWVSCVRPKGHETIPHLCADDVEGVPPLD
jgi:hypothetical protein